MTPLNDKRYLVKLEDGTILGPVAFMDRLRNVNSMGFQLLGGGHSLFHAQLQVIEPTQWLMNGGHIDVRPLPGAKISISEYAQLIPGKPLEWRAI